MLFICIYNCICYLKNKKGINLQDNNLSEIKKRINIADLISNYVSLKKRGTRYIGLCPFHAEKTPSFNVDPEKQFYKCFGCGESGDIFSFIQKYENLSFPEAVELLSERAGIEIVKYTQKTEQKSEKELIYTANAHAMNFFRKSLEIANPEILSYIHRRGITPEIIKTFNIGWAPSDWSSLLKYLENNNVSGELAYKAGLISKNEAGRYYDKFRNRIIFPIQNVMGKPIGFGGRIIEGDEPKYLNSPETPVFHKSKELYGLNLASRSITSMDCALIVEGYMDLIACHRAGITNCVAVLGTALTDEHVKRLSRYTKNIILCFDSDSAGIKATLRSGSMFLQEDIDVKIAQLPEGEDPDSILGKSTANDFMEIIDKSLSLLEFEIKSSLKAFNLKTKEGMVDALSNATKIIAKEPNQIKREGLIKIVAPLHPSFGTSLNVESQIRNEVERNTDRSRVNNNNAGKQNTPFKERPNKYIQSQKILLGGMINGFYTVDSVFDNIDPSYFSGVLIKLAEIIYRYYTLRQNISYDDLVSEVSKLDISNAFYTLLAELDEKDFNANANLLVDIISKEKMRHNTERKKELLKKMELGELKSGEPEYNELLEIIKGNSFTAK